MTKSRLPENIEKIFTPDEHGDIRYNPELFWFLLDYQMGKKSLEEALANACVALNKSAAHAHSCVREFLQEKGRQVEVANKKRWLCKLCDRETNNFAVELWKDRVVMACAHCLAVAKQQCEFWNNALVCNGETGNGDSIVAFTSSITQQTGDSDAADEPIIR